MTVSLAVLLLVSVTSAARLPLLEEQQARSPLPDRTTTTTTTTPFTTTPGFHTTTPFPTTTGSWPEWATCKVENYHYYPTHYLALGECNYYIGGCYEACCQANGHLSSPTFVCDFGGPAFRKRQAQPPVPTTTSGTTTVGTTTSGATTVGTTTSGTWTTPFPATTPTPPGSGCYVENLHYYPAHWLAVGECNAYIGGCYLKCCQPDGNLSPSTYICDFGTPWWGEGPNPQLQP